MRLSVIMVGAAIGAGFYLKDDPGIAGISEVLKIVFQCFSGESPWCDSNFAKSLVTFSMYATVDKFTATAETIASKALHGDNALAGKVAIVTGASSGIGVETTRVLLSHSCHVIMAVRNVKKGAATLDSLNKAAGTSGLPGKGTVLALDLADLSSVKSFAKAFEELKLPLHLLINNAGVMMPSKDNTQLLSKQGRELHFDTNHVGHFQLTALLEKKLLATSDAASPARVVYVSSEGASMWNGPGAAGSMADQVPPTREYSGIHLYALSKALNILTAKEQQKRWGNSTNAIAVAVHPGIVATSLLDNAGPIAAAFFGWPFAFAQKSVAQGASTTIYAALAKQVVDECRAGAFYYYNNKKQDLLHPEYFSDAVAKQTWELTEKLL